ncbi:MAG: ATP phosphoribosyltransferase regulatory subunit [Lachnospiraceae bacterium]|nr:ATP phosphoribosyltransferase regulatory subunit [Lachnospiraceae bacterium]
MNNRVIHTPEGVRDLYGRNKKNKKMLMHKLDGVFDRYGYDDIETPTLEYFEVFSSDIGTTPSNELYKFFDRDGNTLVLRPDFTPSVARAVSMHFSDNAFPARLCYSGSTFVNSREYQGILKESTQMGIELIGDASAAADAEVICVICDLLLSSGLKEFQVSIGEVNFFKSLAERSGLNEETVETIRQLISSKNYFGIDEVLDQSDAPSEIRKALSELPQMFGGPEIFEKALQYAVSPQEMEAVRRLGDIQAILTEKGLDRYVSYDFGSLSKYNYYTGIIFSAFTYGSGEPIARGGRYDHLLGHFGTDRPAVGVGLYLDQLINCLQRQMIPFGQDEEMLRKGDAT